MFLEREGVHTPKIDVTSFFNAHSKVTSHYFHFRSGSISTAHNSKGEDYSKACIPGVGSHYEPFKLVYHTDPKMRDEDHEAREEESSPDGFPMS